MARTTKARSLVAVVTVFVALGFTVVVAASNDRGGSVQQVGVVAPEPSVNQGVPPEKAQIEQAEEARQRQADRGPKAPKEQQGSKPASCVAPSVQPTIEPASDAVPGVRMTPTTQTRVVYGQAVYLVWGGLTTSDGAPADQGQIAVVESPRDACATENPNSVLDVFEMPTQHGTITMVGVNGALVFFETEDGTTGTFNLETKRYS